MEEASGLLPDQGSSLASDVFFPMPDGLEAPEAAGVTAANHLGGSKPDGAVLAAADAAGMAMVVAGRRRY
jgi:phosphoribosylaminoimidazolecarboxamide formyltransferase/IMP cyclohydrolase